MSNTESTNKVDTAPIGELDIAVVHGNYAGRGGGERVAEELARTFDAPIYYGFGYEEYEPEDITTKSIFNDIFGASLIKRIYQFRDLYYMIGFRSVPELLDYDVLIQSGNEPGWYKPPDDQVILKYTHSTPRNAYDRYPYRAPESGPLFELYTFATEQLYKSVIPYPDLYVANSEVVERRLDRYWGVSGEESTVIYPPIEVDSFGPDYQSEAPTNDYYLVLDRLEPTKHIDQIIESFERQNTDLIIAGTGSEEASLKKQAKSNNNIQFEGYVSEQRKRALLAGAKALIYAAEDEDFGIVPIEAFASGTPVIGPREGYTQYQINDGETGILYDRDVGGVTSGIERFEREGINACVNDLISESKKYNINRFKAEMKNAVSKAVDRAQVRVST